MDAAGEWTRAQERVIGLVELSPEPETEQRVPACPDWTVRELLAHMVGLNADVLAGDEPDDHNSEWTQRQVDARADHDVAALVAEWRKLTDAMRAWMAEHGTRPLNDVIIHEHDLRGALSQPGARDSAGLALVRGRMADAFAARVRDAGLAPVALAGPDWSFVTGDGTPGARLAAADFDLARALMSRRTAGQLRGWTADGDIEPYLPAFARLGPLPEQLLPE